MPGLAARVFHAVSALAPCRLGGQGVQAAGGPQPWLNSWVHAVSQGQPVGRCKVSRRAEAAIRAGMWISFAPDGGGGRLGQVGAGDGGGGAGEVEGDYRQDQPGGVGVELPGW